MNVQPFGPSPGGTYNLTLSATGTSSSATLPSAEQVARVINAGSVIVWIRFTTGLSTATTADTAVLPMTSEVFTKGLADTVSVISGGTTAAVYVSIGEGQ